MGSSPGGADRQMLDTEKAAAVALVVGSHRSATSITNSPLEFSFSGRDLFNFCKKHVLFPRSIVAPRLFIVLIESKNGVAFGTTSINNHIFCLP